MPADDGSDRDRDRDRNRDLADRAGRPDRPGREILASPGHAEVDDESRGGRIARFETGRA